MSAAHNPKPSVLRVYVWDSNFNGNVYQTVSEIIQHVWDKTKNNSPLL